MNPSRLPIPPSGHEGAEVIYFAATVNRRAVWALRRSFELQTFNMSNNTLNNMQKDFLQLFVERQALKFGDFTLKSGRQSPYFINTGCFHMASDLKALGSAYAQIIKDHCGEIDVIFGPAYKGIPLALAAANSLAEEHDCDIAWSYDRKEVKTHGDGGAFVGAPLEKGTRVVIVDDVMTAGTALRESIEKLRPLGVEIVAAVISVDRMEKGTGEKPAAEEISDEFNLPIHSIINIRSAVEYLAINDVNGQRYLDAAGLERMNSYLNGL
ncbi:MAG: orotate phosphoribosyltransferase [Planctomycetes bacterium]|nr:orotate phosphoribosyltransferase [Planctomycetota bacterium]